MTLISAYLSLCVYVVSIYVHMWAHHIPQHSWDDKRTARFPVLASYPTWDRLSSLLFIAEHTGLASPQASENYSVSMPPPMSLWALGLPGITEAVFYTCESWRFQFQFQYLHDMHFIHWTIPLSPLIRHIFWHRISAFHLQWSNKMFSKGCIFK